MDERHWWMAGKIQESFHIGGYDNPTLLEDFFDNDQTLEMINGFLSAGGQSRLFFYCDRPETGMLSTRQLHITGTLASLKDVNLEAITILYFLRRDTEREVDAVHMEKDIYSGELKGNPINILNSLLTEIFLPLIRAKKDWGQCTEEHKQYLVQNLEKTVSNLSETDGTSLASKHAMLRAPESVVGADFKHHRLAALDQNIIAEYEKLVTEWMSTIEAILGDTSDERFMDPNAGPLSELERWRRRQRLLTGIMEQLKGKECKAVIGVLITAKSRLIKKWKLVDCGITDAMNETKDKVRYLESLKRYLDMLYHGATPANIISVALPGLLAAVKQMDSVSRFYSRQGFLGLLFTKVTNQLVLACKEYIHEATLTPPDIDLLWSKVQEEVHQRESTPIGQTPIGDPQQKHFQSQLESRLKTSSSRSSRRVVPVDSSSDTLYQRLRACLTLQSVYRDTIRTLRDSLGNSSMLSHFTSVGSLAQAPTRSRQGQLTTASRQWGKLSTSSPFKKQLSDHEGHGVSVADEETIMSHIDEFCSRIRQIIDIVNTLSQFNKVVKTTAGVPRPRKEHIVCDKSIEDTLAPDEELSPDPYQAPLHDTRVLGAITEDEENTSEREEDKRGDGKQSGMGDTLFDFTNKSSGLTQADVDLLHNYYDEEGTEEGPSVSSIIRDHVTKMTDTMRDNVTTKTMLDVESKDKERFDMIYNTFQSIVQELERFVGAYLRAIFTKKMKTHEGLDLLTKFTPVQQRASIRIVISEKFVEVFNWYGADLDSIQVLYNKHKDDPPLIRNAPPVAGAIQWSRQLLKRIEDPMVVFRDNKSVSHLKDFSHTAKIYNRLATALVTFENLWLTFWKSQIEQARTGLCATLLVQHPDTKELLVNADDKVLTMIHEAKWLSRIGIVVPEGAQEVQLQEEKFKSYKNHLELVLRQFHDVKDSIPAPVKTWFQPHVDVVVTSFQPGLNTLAWNCMNIDAFLYNIHSNIERLRDLVKQVNHILQTKVEGTIQKISDMVFFDFQLAFSRSWPPPAFSDVMGNSLKECSLRLQELMATIEDGARECAHKLLGKTDITDRFRLRKKRPSNFLKIQRGQQRKTSRAIGTPDFTKSRKEEKAIGDFLASYHDDIYDAVLTAINRSLVTLAESSGCDEQAARAATQLTDTLSAGGRTSFMRSNSPMRSFSAASEKSAPSSILSILSDMTWTSDKTDAVTYLQFDVEMKFSIPDIVVEPALDSIQTAVSTVARSILQVPEAMNCEGAEDLGSLFVSHIKNEESVDSLMRRIDRVLDELNSVVEQHIFHFSLYNFLWKDDMYGNYRQFVENKPTMIAMNSEVEQLLKIEKKVIGIPNVLPVGPICLHTDPVKDALHGFAMAWKSQFASPLHEDAKRKLDAAILYRSNVRQRLELNVINLDHLNSTLHLLEELHDMENKIDDEYLPIETMYAKLRDFELRLPRSEVQEVDQLRENWHKLLETADDVRNSLLKQQRGAFEQELDKQVKTFIVETIQFRNAFDAQGPAVPGIPPETAVRRLADFQQRYSLYSAKRKTLDSVSQLFAIPCKLFSELDKTGEELELLGMLYGLFQKFIQFDQKFRDTLWAEVDLEHATSEVESYWDECLALPSKLKDWDAYNEMKSSIQFYRDVFPLLCSLASKEIRNRHWLQVMSVTGSSFQLEATVFRLVALLDAGLIKHRAEIENICHSASRELELEVKLRQTEEEWTEQVFNFEHYKRRGPMYLEKASTERLLEQLEDAQALLAHMLTSRYIGPLRDEAASWAEKLKEVGEVLEQWLEAQDLWQYLEAVFSNPATAKELPQEVKRFSMIDKGWTKMMKRAYETRNVLQCCYGEEVPKGVVLRHIYQELEVCFKSLTGYLDNKRHNFPRFYFVSDPVLLAILSRPKDLESVRPHLRSLFTAIHDVNLVKLTVERDDDSPTNLEKHSSRTRSSLEMDKPGSRLMMMSPHINTPTKFDKRLTQLQSAGPHITQHISVMLPSELTTEDVVDMEASGVVSIEGETLKLQEKIGLTKGVDSWLLELKQQVTKSLHDLVLGIAGDCSSGVPFEEWVLKYPAQVCKLGMIMYWTRECEQGVSDLRFDRKALFNTSKRFGAAIGRLPTVLAKGSWKNVDEPMLPVHKTRLETMITQSLFLRDTIDYLANRKIREITDFEWRRNVRFYVHNIDDQPEPCLYILDQQYTYGCEFYGAQPSLAITPLMDKSFFCMSQAISQYKGSLMVGQTGSGKSETVKGFAQLLGQGMMMFQCTQTADHSAVGRILHGMAMDGCWGCFENIHHLSDECVSMMVSYVFSIVSALKSKANYCYIGDAHEVPIVNTVMMFATYNPTVQNPYPLPTDIRALFRQVSLIKPDLAMVLKAKCSNSGFRSPQILATRLNVIQQLAKDQLPNDVQHHLSVASLVGVLQRANQRKKFIREDKSTERGDKRGSDGQEQSRSNSVQSTAASSFALTQQMSLLNAQLAPKAPGSKKLLAQNPMSAAAKMDHAIVGYTLLEMIGPRLTSEYAAVFNQIVKDIFAGLPEPPGGYLTSANQRSFDIQMAVEQAAESHGLIAHKPWIDKCMQLYSISQVHQGIVIAGPPGAGKSTVVRGLIEALRNVSKSGSRSSPNRAADLAEANHKLQKLYPLVVDDLALIFGSLNQNHDWVDGIFTSAWRKASRNQSTTWLCMDGPMTPNWTDYFTSVLDSSKTLSLANGDQLFLSNNMKLLFETVDLQGASPALLVRTGILYVDTTVVGWKPIAKAWLEDRNQQELHVLQRAFNKTVDAMSHYVTTECRPKLKLSEQGMFQTCLNLLSAMLKDNIEIGGELHIERLYLFCLMWSYGGLLNTKEQKGFNELLATLSTALPDDDRDISYFDYYVDESGEWDPWQSRITEANCTAESNDLLGDVFVDTISAIRTRLLMEFACALGQNVLLVGPPGSGKTAMINDFMNTQDPQNQISKKLVCSGSSKAVQLHQFIEANIYHRQGFVYGAKDNNRLQLFIDDINLPNADEYGVRHYNELLRGLLDDKVLCTQQKPFEWRTVEDMMVLAAMSLSGAPSEESRLLNARFLRHFAVFYLPVPEDDSQKHVVQGLLEALMLQGQPGLDIELHNAIVQASCKLLTAVKDVLKPTATPGRAHYRFSLRDLVTCFQCLKRLPDESRADETLVVSLWRHEMERIIRDRLCRHADCLWFDDTMQDVLKEMWPEMVDSLHQHFVTFPTDMKVYNRPVTSLSKREVKVSLQPVSSMREVHNCLLNHLTRYNQEFGNTQLNIMLSDNIIHHVIKMHRILSYHHDGNFLLVGPIGSHLGTLCKLALHVADLPIHPIDTSKQNTFFDGLRSAVRLTGSEGRIRTIFFSGRDLHDDLYLDAINSILVSGEYPHLFTNDELEGLLQALVPAMKREHPNKNVDLTKFFVSRVKTNLHIMVALPPTHKLFRVATRQYPGLLSGCQVITVCDWTKEALLGQATYFLNMRKLMKDCEEDISDGVVNCVANIHSYVLNECRQTKWAGSFEETISLTSVKTNDKKKDVIKSQTLSLPNRPYSKAIMLENIRLNHKSNDSTTSNELFVGPTTFWRFLATLEQLYLQKAEFRTKTVNRLKRVLVTLEKTRKDTKLMKQSIQDITGKYEVAHGNTADLLLKLTAKVTTLEKLKAKLGMSTSLSAFLELNELREECEEEEELLYQEDRDEYDEEFDRMREANLKTRLVQAKDEHTAALKTVDQCRSKLSYAKQQVLHWKDQVDRSCIDRLKAFQNPPSLIGHIMEMVMTLIGKRLPSQRLDQIDAYPSHDGQSGHFSAGSSSTKMANVRKTMRSRGDEKFDRSQWKTMQQTMLDSAKFVDMLHNVPWEDGLPKDVVAAVESYLCKSRDGQLGVTGEGSMLDNAAEREKTLVATRGTTGSGTPQGITLAAAKYSSEDAATLVNYTIAIVEYTQLCGPLKTALEKVQELQREIEENERLQKEKENEMMSGGNAQPQEEEREPTPPPEEELTESDLERIEKEVEDLQDEFDKAVVEKHSLELELTSMKERLKAATDLMQSMKVEEKKWRLHVKEFGSNGVLVTNCIAAAAFLTYCGGMNTDARKRLGEFFMSICEHHAIPRPINRLFKDRELIEFLYTNLEIQELEQQSLPKTPLLLENATFLMQGDTTMSWPLICDPTSRALEWVRTYMKGKGLVEVRYSELRSQFDNCLADGQPLLVTDIDVNVFKNDLRFCRVILSRTRFTAGTNPFKIPVGDHEVECQPQFRMFLHTTSPANNVPAELAAHVSVIYFHETRHDLEEELLDRFIILEKPRIEEERAALLQERLENLEHMEKLKDQIEELLSSEVRLLNDLHATKKLLELKKQYDETQDSESRVESNEKAIMRAREGFRIIANRGAVCFDTTQYMREINPLYQFSFEQFVELYDTAISHSDRTAVKAVVDRLVTMAFVTTIRSLFDRDKPVYSLLIALEIEDAMGNTGPGEREFLISPTLGSVTMTAIGCVQPNDSKFVQAKKPFDWMAEEQFLNLQTLAIHFEWFQEMFDRMSRDGRETQWRMLCETEQPELQVLPDKMDDQLTALQRVLVIRAVRSDRLMQLGVCFVNATLGKKFIGEIPLDLPLVLRQSSPRTPILMLHCQEHDSAEKLVMDFAARKQIRLVRVVMSGVGAPEERAARKVLHKAMADGQWVLLQNGHNARTLLNSLESVFAEQDNVDPQFRLWITASADPRRIPVHVLHKCIKVMVDSPKTMKDSILRSFAWMDADILKQSSRNEWPAVLHNICYLHAAIQLRARFGKAGWNVPETIQDLSNNELFETLSFLTAEFKDNITVVSSDGSLVPRTMSWSGLRYMLSEVIYGSLITDPLDQQTLTAMIDYWISPNGVKKDFEFPKLKYKLPAVFFSSHPRLGQLVTALENIPNHLLETPEACNLHSSGETLLGDDQYIFTRLNKVYDAMPASKTLSHQIFPRPPSAADGIPYANVSGSSNNPQVVSRGVFASASFAALRLRKETDLWEICHSMLPRLPKAYSKEYVNERVKKIGGATSFNLYIMKELEVLYTLLVEIKSTLQGIKTACEVPEHFGDCLTPRMLDAADDLYHLLIPRHWRRLAGNTAPPANQSLLTWMTDLQNRAQHFEKILVLGRDKMPAYWLGAFVHPRGLLALLKQDSYKQYVQERGGNIDTIVFQTEITARDKDHIRDPPAEGMFIYGLYLWGCTWEKAVTELVDSPPRHSCASLPVIHVTCWPQGEKPLLQDPARAAETYACPVYHTSVSDKVPVMELDLSHGGIPASRWALRGLKATIRNF